MEKEYTLINFIEDFENRKGKDLEDKLFFYLDYIVRDENFNQQTHVRSYDAKNRYERLNRMFENTKDNVIESNIYLKKCKEFFETTKENSADLLIDFRSGDNFVVKKEISVEELLPEIDEPELLGLDIVKTYNSVSKQLDNMYVEITRLNIWNMINNTEDCKDDIATVILKKDSNDKATLIATFQDKTKVNTYIDRAYTL